LWLDLKKKQGRRSKEEKMDMKHEAIKEEDAELEEIEVSRLLCQPE
jgi:hypothetical protein